MIAPASIIYSLGVFILIASIKFWNISVWISVNELEVRKIPETSHWACIIINQLYNNNNNNICGCCSIASTIRPCLPEKFYKVYVFILAAKISKFI